MGRKPCCSKVGLNRGAWSSDEDKLLTNYVQTFGEGQWRGLPSKAGLLRCGKSCRLRWMNYLRPGIKRGNFTSEENELIIQLQFLHGNCWSLIATKLPGRTDNELKNHWNAHLRKGKGNARKHHTKKDMKVTKNRSILDDKRLKTKSPEKSKEVKDVETRISSSSASSMSLTRNESGASSSSTFDLVDADFDFSWPVLDVKSTSAINYQHDMFLMLENFLTKDDESLMLEKLYLEYQNLLND